MNLCQLRQDSDTTCSSQVNIPERQSISEEVETNAHKFVLAHVILSCASAVDTDTFVQCTRESATREALQLLRCVSG